MILNFRGTNGSGKSTLVRQALVREKDPQLHDTYTKEIDSPTKKDPTRRLPKTIQLLGGKKVMVMGSYLNKCGGCDEYSWKGSHDWMCEAIRNWARHRPSEFLIFEGITVSSVYQRYVDLAMEIHKTHSIPTAWMMLDIPLDLCLERVSARSGRTVDDRMRGNVGSKHSVVHHFGDKLFNDPNVNRGALRWKTYDRNSQAEDDLDRVLDGKPVHSLTVDYL